MAPSPSARAATWLGVRRHGRPAHRPGRPRHDHIAVAGGYPARDVTGLPDPGRGGTVAILAGQPAWRDRGGIWPALEEAFGLAFVDEGRLAQADAVVVLPGGRPPERLAVPCLVLEPATDVRRSPFVVEVSRGDGVDHALRGQRLTEDAGRLPAPLPVGTAWRVLATAGGRPVWTRWTGAGGDREVASASCRERV